jgi:hypothetical protein
VVSPALGRIRSSLRRNPPSTTENRKVSLGGVAHGEQAHNEKLIFGRNGNEEGGPAVCVAATASDKKNRKGRKNVD